MPNYNYYKTISANMLVTTHDLNFVMGFIKEDEIYNPQTGVRASFFRTLKTLITLSQLKLILDFFSFHRPSKSLTSYRRSKDGANLHLGRELILERLFNEDHHRWWLQRTTSTRKLLEIKSKTMGIR